MLRGLGLGLLQPLGLACLVLLVERGSFHGLHKSVLVFEVLHWRYFCFLLPSCRTIALRQDLKGLWMLLIAFFVWQYLSAIDVFVFPSQTTAFGGPHRDWKKAIFYLAVVKIC
jgi:hypothetical protein